MTEVKDKNIHLYLINLDLYDKGDIPLQIKGEEITTIPRISILEPQGARKYTTSDGKRTSGEILMVAQQRCGIGSVGLGGGHWNTPKNKSDRKEEFKKFGPHCFLIPQELKFPI